MGYGFDTTLAPSGTGAGNFYEGSAALGYQIVGNGLAASGFVGPDYQNYSIHPGQ